MTAADQIAPGSTFAALPASRRASAPICASGSRAGACRRASWSLPTGSCSSSARAACERRSKWSIFVPDAEAAVRAGALLVRHVPLARPAVAGPARPGQQPLRAAHAGSRRRWLPRRYFRRDGHGAGAEERHQRRRHRLHRAHRVSRRAQRGPARGDDAGRRRHAGRARHHAPRPRRMSPAASPARASSARCACYAAT